MAQMVKNVSARGETQVGFLGQEDPLEKGMATHYRELPREFQSQRIMVGYIVSGVTESWTRLSK